MRLAVAVAFLAIAACAGLQVWMNHRTAESWALDTALGESAGRHEAQTQRIGRLAALIALQESEAPRHVAELARLLDETRQLALKAQDQVTRLRSQEGDQAGPVVEAVEAWQAAQERLWYRADLMQSRADERLASLAEAGAAVQAEADRAGGAARALQQHLRRHAQERQESTVMAARVGAVFTVGLLLLLTLAVVRPALRTLHEQSRRLAQQAAENERLAEVAERTGKLVIITDAERRLVWANATFTRVTGWELHEALGRTPGELLQSERTDPQAVARLREALQAGQGARVELLNRSRDGRDYWIDADIQPQFDAQGGLTGFIAVEAVITEQVTERQRATALLAALPSAVVVHGPDGRVRDANPAARGLLGCTDGDPPEALLDRHPAHEDLEPLVAAELPVARSLRTGQGERGRLIVITDGEGQRRWLLVNTEVLTDALGLHDGVVACYIDMTERRQLLEQLRDSAERDALTRMPNRAAVLERVQRAIDHRRRHPGYGFAVLFMDVDRFKQVNDSLGHAQGDELLRQVAQRLEDTLRPGDTVGRVGSELRTAARIGGDEFVVVLEGVRQPDDVAAVADRILQSLGEPYRLGSVPVHVSVSIGIVTAEQAGDDALAVLRDGDTAMYEAKRAGRGRWVAFDPAMHERLRASMELEGDLRQALVSDQLYVVYQPVVDLGDEGLHGVEALVRWRHPERGEIGPGAFIPLAEECGLIDAIGDLVLHKACEQFARWQQRWGSRAPKVVAVNLSRAQLRQPGLVPEVQAVLEANGMRPEQLQLEVTESFAAQDPQMQAMLRALKAAGVRLALDDFGTGYSSLACLHLLPVDTVKIDRSFVAHARDVEYHRVLIGATIRVAWSLGMSTVAEGIETQDQADLMGELKCDRGQGYFFGRPMTAEALDRWIETESTGTVA